MSARFLSLLALLAVGVTRAGLADDVGGNTFAPETYKIERYEHVWKSHPFITETPPIVTSAGLASKYGLVGILWLDKKPMVFLIDRNETDPARNRFTVSQGMPDQRRNVELLSVTMDRDPRKSSALIKQGVEQAPIPFDTSTLPPTGPVGSSPGMSQPTLGYTPPQPSGAIPPPPPGMMPQPGNGNVVRLPIGGASGQIVPGSPNQPYPVNPTGQVAPPTPTRRIIRPKPINVN